MSTVERVNAGVNWTVTSVFSFCWQNSERFVLQSDGQDVSFTLGCGPAASLIKFGADVFEHLQPLSRQIVENS